MSITKIKTIFDQFDKNRDGGLNRQEMAALVVAVNSMVNFTPDQITAIIDQVFVTYHHFVDQNTGLSLQGLVQTYDDGAGEIDRDFTALGLVETKTTSFRDSQIVSFTNDNLINQIKYDLKALIRKLKTSCGFGGGGVDWSSELLDNKSNNKGGIVWEENGGAYDAFVKELGVLRKRVERGRERFELFNGEMMIGNVLYESKLVREALVSFKRVCELEPGDVKAHFRLGNCLYVLGKGNEAKGEFEIALGGAEGNVGTSGYLLPQIHVNLGIAFESEGMVISACEHYKEAAILCPTHFRALKLLGSGLFGVGEYRAAVKALEEAVYLKNDYVDARCDLASALHALGEDDYAIKEFQKAIDLCPGHVDALYNLGGLYMEMGRYQRASEMYTRVLSVVPDHWRAQLNKAVAMLGVGETDEAKKALKEALKMTNRVEMHDAMEHLKQLEKKRLKGNEGVDKEAGFIVVDSSKFKMVGESTTSRQELANAIEIRAFQRISRLSSCNVDLLKKEMNEQNAPAVTYSGNGVPEKSIRKTYLEKILRRLLSFLKPEAFVGAVKAINQKILCLLDETDSGRIDLGMFLAVLAPICTGPPERRKRVAFDALVWRSSNEDATHIKKVDAVRYIKLLRAIYIPSRSEMQEIHGETDAAMVSSTEFLVMFDDLNFGFDVMSSLAKLEAGDRHRHGRHSCAICRYPIIGSRFKEMKSHFSLCSQCYSEGKVPSNLKQEEYRFKEYASESEGSKHGCMWFGGAHSKTSSPVDPLR